ncbi:ribonuclease R [Sandaracinus amylolyticus]|uniref:ribonuclease R n=1 Tax=Sandaracinus amylolyticus TaxID=927083 RepID=UPI001EFFCD65|nr:ribonuclease R [Sandaracinus amylolyticus]UJR81847.1 Ribonuclease R [Sandaracinus amylolyticus]
MSTTKSIGREQVMNALRASGGRSLHVMEIVQILGAPKSARDEVRDRLQDLKELGLAKELPGNRYKVGPGRKHAAPPPPEAFVTKPRHKREAEQEAAERFEKPRAPGGPAVTGWLTITPRGFGFVAADDGGPDVFVSARSLANAMHGDRVEVSARRTEKGREGEVLRIVDRGLLRIAGRLTRARRVYLIETHDARLPEVFRVSGTLPLETEPGSDVVAQITKYPEFPGEIPEARVLRVLGPRGSAEVEIAKILIREGVVEEFPEDVVQEALGFPAQVPDHDIREREDLRHLDLVTIDPEDARDHDDAVWAEQTPDGFRVIVAIADVSHYVREGSAIDREALTRGTSIYLPGRAIPMLPPELSTNLASLVPDEDRLTLAVEVRLGKLGKILSHRLIEGVMRSKARISYGGAARALGLTEDAPRQESAEQHLPLLKVLHQISRRLRALRNRRGALGFELPEAKVLLDKSGEPRDVIRSRSDAGIKEAYEIVEDLMLLANEVVAEDLTRRKVPAIFRVHGKPDPNKVETFAAVAEAFGHALEENAAESPKKLQKFLDRIAGTPHAQSLGFLLLRAMQQASYDTRNLGHFALAARDYLHFTSPIRRYPDLAVHRVVRALARGERIEATALREKLQQQAQQSSRMERRAMTVERESVNLYRCLLMKDRVGEEFEGTITGVTEHGLWVSLDLPFVETRAPIERLGEDYYELDRLGIRLVGRRSGHSFALGGRLTVRLESVVIERREMVAVPITLPEARRTERRRSERPRAHAEEPRRERPSRAPRPQKPGKHRDRGPRRSR